MNLSQRVEIPCPYECPGELTVYVDRMSGTLLDVEGECPHVNQWLMGQVDEGVLKDALDNFNSPGL